MNSPTRPPDPHSAAPEARPHVTRREFLQIFTAVMLPMFMAMIDQTLLATATPIVASEFSNLYDTSWIATAYLLCSAVMVPVYGRLGDRHGRRNMLTLALGVFVAGSCLAALSGSMSCLIAGRAVQGLGAGGLMSLSFALIGELVPPRQRVSYQGYFAIISMTANVLGPIVGGQVVTYVSWRWLFAINLPLGLLAAWRLSKLKGVGRSNAAAPGVSDIPGLMLFAAGTLLLLFGFSSAGHRFDWFSWQTGVLLGAGALTWAGLFVHEKRLTAPFFPVELLAVRPIRLCLVNAVCSTFCLLALVFYLPVYYQLGLGISAARSGTLLAPVLIGFILGGTLGGRHVGRTGAPQPVPVVGLSVAGAGLLVLALASPAPLLIAVTGFITGLGLGPTMPTVQVIVQTIAGRERMGVATSLVVLSRTLGAALGTAVIGGVIYSLLPEADVALWLNRNSGTVAAQSEGVLHAFHIAFFATALIALLGAFNASRVPRIQV